MDNDSLRAAVKIYQNIGAPAVITDAKLNVLWSNGRVGEDELRALKSCLSASKTLLKDSIRALRKYGSAYIPLPAYPLVADGVSVVKSGGFYIAVLQRAASRGGEPFYLGSADRYEGAVRGYIDTLAMSADAAERAADSDDPKLAELFDNIRRSAYRVLRATGAASSFAKTVTGGELSSRRACDIGELVTRLCEGVRGACRGVKLTYQTPSAPVIAYIDVRYAERALLSVLSNSLIYTRDGSEVGVKLTSGAGRIIITVKDRGQGIKPETLPHVREPYYSREPAADSDYSPSLGLGLTLAAGFCESHGGALAIESVYGEGTTVALSIADDLPEGAANTVKAALPNYVTDRYSAIYIELCDLCDIPH